MQKLVALIIVALGALVVWQTLETQALRTEVAALRGELEAGAGRGLRADTHEARADGFLPAGDRVALPPTEPDAEGPSLLGPDAASATVVRAVRTLQARVDAQERRLGGVEERVEATTPERGRRVFQSRKVIANLDQAESILDLSSGQRADVERILEGARRDLEDLRALPNDQGRTLAEVTKPRMVKGEGFSMAMTDFSAVQKFKNTTIPGSNETYGEAEQRISKRAKQDVRDVLSPSQRKTWDQSWTQGLLGQSSSTISIASIGVEADDDE